MTTSEQHGNRWEAHPVLARLLRLAVVVVPLAAAIGTAVALRPLMPPPDGRAQQLVMWAGVLAASTVVLVVVERVARRLLPLATLLQLTLLFPDQVPSRYALARRLHSTRTLEERIEAAAQAGAAGSAAAAAEAILELVVALDEHDRRTRGHAERVRVFTDLLALELHLSRDDRDRLRWAALLHDVGKLVVPAEILNKAGRPSDAEWEVLHEHPAAGARLVGPLVAWLGEWAGAIEQHHERWDGTGYPHRVGGEAISRAARIVAVADTFETITAARPYKRPLSAAAAREELARCAGTQFDPAMVRAFLNISIGRLRLAMGPLSWVAQVPFLPGLSGGLTQPLSALAAQGGAAVAAVTLAVLPAPWSGATDQFVSRQPVLAAQQSAVVAAGDNRPQHMTDAGSVPFGTSAPPPGVGASASAEMPEPAAAADPSPSASSEPSAAPSASHAASAVSPSAPSRPSAESPPSAPSGTSAVSPGPSAASPSAASGPAPPAPSAGLPSASPGRRSRGRLRRPRRLQGCRLRRPGRRSRRRLRRPRRLQGCRLHRPGRR